MLLVLLLGVVGYPIPNFWRTSSLLHKDQCDDVIKLVRSYPTLCYDVPSPTNILPHDIDVGSADPIKQHA